MHTTFHRTPLLIAEVMNLKPKFLITLSLLPFNYISRQNPPQLVLIIVNTKTQAMRMPDQDEFDLADNNYLLSTVKVK